MEEIDDLNSLKPDLEHKTKYCVLQRPENGQKSIGPCVWYVYTPLRFATIRLRLRNSKLMLDLGKKELLVEIGTPEVDIYMKSCELIQKFQY